jgi:hypothetical protein
MKHGYAIWWIYLSGYLTAAAIQYEMDGVVLAYTAPSSPARNAVEQFLRSEQHHPFKEVLEDKPGESERKNVTVKFVPENRGKSYKIRQIVEGGEVIFQAVDTPEEFWYIFREFGPGTEFTCDDVLHSSVLEIDPPALRAFVREHVAPLHLGDRRNLEVTLFFSVLMDHLNHEPALLVRVLRELQAIAKMKSDTPQWPQEERQAVVKHAAQWLGLEEGDLRTLDLRELNSGSATEAPVASRKSLWGVAKVRTPHPKADEHTSQVSAQ